MKTKYVFWIALFLALPIYAGEDVTPMVQEEFKKAQADVTAEWKRVTGRVQELLKAKAKAVEEAKKKAEGQTKQVELLKKYSLLLGTRYRNDKGEYDKGIELTLKDSENLNKMLRSFLSWTPIQGRISVGEARRNIDWASARLVEMARFNTEPTETNNSDLELITHQMKELEIGRVKVETMAKALDLPLDGAKSKGKSADEGEKERSNSSED